MLILFNLWLAFLSAAVWSPRRPISTALRYQLIATATYLPWAISGFASGSPSLGSLRSAVAPPPPVARQSFLIFQTPLTSTDTRPARGGCFVFRAAKPVRATSVGSLAVLPRFLRALCASVRDFWIPGQGSEEEGRKFLSPRHGDHGEEMA